jgi:hypothetical protein
MKKHSKIIEMCNVNVLAVPFRAWLRQRGKTIVEFLLISWFSSCFDFIFEGLS